MHLSWVAKTNIDYDTLARLYKNWLLPLNVVNHNLIFSNAIYGISHTRIKQTYKSYF